MVFRRLLRLGSFHSFWRQDNVTPIPKGPSSSNVANYRPISITPVISNVEEHLVSVDSDDLWNAVVCFHPPSLLIEKVGVPVIHFCVSHTLHSALESGQEARAVQIDFSTAFDTVNHQGINSLYKLCSVDSGGSVLYRLTQFPFNRSQHVMVDGCQRKLVNG